MKTKDLAIVAIGLGVVCGGIYFMQDAYTGEPVAPEPVVEEVTALPDPFTETIVTEHVETSTPIEGVISIPIDSTTSTPIEEETSTPIEG